MNKVLCAAITQSHLKSPPTVFCTALTAEVPLDPALLHFVSEFHRLELLISAKFTTVGIRNLKTTEGEVALD